MIIVLEHHPLWGKDVQIYYFPNTVYSFITNITLRKSRSDEYTGSGAMNYQDDYFHPNTVLISLYYGISSSDCFPASKNHGVRSQEGLVLSLPETKALKPKNMSSSVLKCAEKF